MKREHLYVVAAVIWGIPGVLLTTKGIEAYGMQMSDSLWWMFLITAAVMVAFFLMFRRIVRRYCDRIASLPDKVKIWQTFLAFSSSIFLASLQYLQLHFIPVSDRCSCSLPEDF